MIATESTNGNVGVSVKSFTALFAEAEHPIAIDTYQRAYVWGDDKVNQLITDLEEYCRKSNQAEPSLDYYMGAVLLHRNSDQNKLFIIDGQQRITSLCVLHHALTGALPKNHELSYRSPLSMDNIKRAQARFESTSLGQIAADLFGHICFTVITVSSEDLAFTFFDTQNNRGVPLQATDLLKAYHLRAISGDDSLRLQTNCAERWERMQGSQQILGHGADFAPTLFYQFLWRARRWTGQKLIARETYDDILAEFQNNAIRPKSPHTFEIYASRNNQLGSALSLLPQEGYRLEPQPIRLSGSAAQLPFALRHPISQGIGFFLYADKYAALTAGLLYDSYPDHEVSAFRRLYEELIGDLSLYLRELFLLSSVMYVDQFGSGQLLHFALWLDYVLGAIRLDKQYIFKEAPLIFLRDSSHNLLDVIAGAFRPDEVIAYLKSDPRAQTIYETDTIKAGVGVQGRYKQQVLDYYSKTDSLKEKRRWIADKLKEEFHS